MCLAAIALGAHPRFPVVLAANRDEFHDRPAAPLGWWQPPGGGPALLSGRDLSAGGTWLGLTAVGHLALVTNVREPGCFNPARPSRGELVPQWLAAPTFDLHALAALAAAPRNGFNLLVADLGRDRAAWAGNRPPQARAVAGRLAGLSNAALDTPWPKVTALKARLAQAVEQAGSLDALAATAWQALADPAPAPDERLPDTGLPLERERMLSPAFIHIPAGADHAAYGTRCATLVVAEQDGSGRRVHVVERRFSAAGAPVGDTTVTFALAG